MNSKKLPRTSFRLSFSLLSQYFLLHMRAACKMYKELTLTQCVRAPWLFFLIRKAIVVANFFFFSEDFTWNFVNSSARNSSLRRISRTTCWGKRVKEPRLRTSLPCSSTNSRTFDRKKTIHTWNDWYRDLRYGTHFSSDQKLLDSLIFRWLIRLLGFAYQSK